MEIKYLSWNVNRLNIPQKRRKKIYWLAKQKLSVVCLQEVYINKKDNKYLKYKALGYEFFFFGKNKK